MATRPRFRRAGAALVSAFTLAFLSCVQAPQTPQKPVTPADVVATTVARHEPAPNAQQLIVIPENWRAEHPFALRFPEMTPADGAHVIDLAAIRFSTDTLVDVASNGRRTYAMPNLSSFPHQLDTRPFTATSDDYFIVQAKSPADQHALRGWLESVGIPVMDYLPHLAYLVRVSAQQLAEIEQRPEVFWTGHYSPAFRVDPLLDYVIHTNPAQQVHLRVLFDGDRHKDLGPLLDRLAEAGLGDPKSTRRARDWSIRGKAIAASARKLAMLPGFLWVERYFPPQLANNTARSSQSIVTGRGATNGPIMDVEDVWARGIRGEGQIAAASDTGLSTGNTGTMHQDFGQTGSATNPMRLIAGYALGRASWNDDQAIGGGHGTHTSGSIVGNGFRSGSSPSTNSFPTTSYAGTAPKAQFVFQSIMDSGGGLSGIPLNLNDLFQQAYNDGARVHSNSWGANASGAYTTDAQELDQFSWRNKDMVITFAAGNSGDDTGTPGPIDGIINRESINSPGTAKNGITVGATENYRPDFVYEFPAGDCTSSNGLEQKAWGWFNPFNFGTAPLLNDLMADNANGMGAFSSRGPTDDGRVKPDVVAPGIAIVSTRTDVNQTYEHWGICVIPVGFRPYYITQGGTSMANPLTAGAATLVRQYYVDGWHANHNTETNSAPVQFHGFNPSSALVKATLINGAWDMNPGQYGTGASREMPPGWDTGATLPNHAEGFGRVDVERALFPGSGFSDHVGKRRQVHDVASGLFTGQATAFTFDVGGNGDPLVATLVWTDPPAAIGAGAKLVNNLDLTVTAPNGGTTFFPNGIDKTSGADNINNVEQVMVSNPAVGTWTITVTAASVPGNLEAGSNFQPFALVISGVGCANAPSVPAGVTATATAPNAVTVNWSASSGSPVSYRIYRSGPASSCPNGGYTLVGTVNAPAVSFQDVTVSGGGTYSYKVSAVGTCESAQSSCSSAVATGICTTPPSFGGTFGVTTSNSLTCALFVAWTDAAAGCNGAITYNVYRSTTSGFIPSPANRIAAGITATTFNDLNVSIGTTYHYIVRAMENGIEDLNLVEQSGTAAGSGVVAFTQNFDSLPATSLAGFTTSGTGAADWRGVMSCLPTVSGTSVFRFGGPGCSETYANGANTQAVINGATGVAIPAGATSVRLDFWHRWDFESGFDGGAIRIARAGDAAFTNVPGSAILVGPYNNSAGGQSVWSGAFNTSINNSVVDLDAACNAIAGNTGGCAGKTIFVAFTAISDSSVVRAGWSIDDVDVTYVAACTACTPPGAPTGLALSVPASNTVRLTWSAGVPAGATYNVYRETGTCPVTAPVRVASGITATTYDDTGLAGGTTYRYIVRAVAASGCESGNSACQSAAATGAALAPPPNLIATASGTSSVAITWGPVVGAASYVLERSTDNASFTPIGITAGLGMTDSGRATNTSYLYRVSARTAAAVTSAASRDIATMIIYIDSPLVAGTTRVKVMHLSQLRTAVNAVRALAGLGPVAFTNPTLLAGSTTIKQAHISELRTGLDAARSILALPALVYTDPSITVDVTKVKTAHVEQLRNGTK
jgi:fibronectin type 3 domain-containing protein